MNLLVLGGTRFLGRHVVDAALARGDAVTVFTRGRQPNPWGTAVTALVGDRDPAIAPGLAALERGAWDAAIDLSGYVPRIVRASAELLAPRVGRYLFVSSISVFTDASRPGLDETAPVGVLEDPASEEIGKHYGPLKAACEAVVGRGIRRARDQRAAGADRGAVRSHRPVRLLGCALRASTFARCPCGSGNRSVARGAAAAVHRRARPRRLHARSPRADASGTFIASSPARPMDVRYAGAGARRGRRTGSAAAGVDGRGRAARAQGRALDGASAVDSHHVRR